ncbi:hypothetical protein AP1_0176 [Aeromonas phage AP1]|nr:hypothetical protein assk_74 [Aeromonas phage Assk]QMV28883.1 hypothetical protein AP1_0176 [Aeromonas phage AP1]
MKLVSHNKVCPTFGVDFHGVKLTLPMKYLYGFLAMNYDGTVVAYIHPPLFNGENWSDTYPHRDDIYVAKVETDIHPSKTLVCISDNRVKKYME